MDNYDLLTPIGEGAFGLVFKAVHKPTGQEVALKRILFVGRTAVTRVPKLIDVLKEIKLLATIDCENVVKLLDWFLHGSTYVLAFDLMPSGLLEYIYDLQAPLQTGEIKAYLRMLLKGVAYLHAHSIIHRDIKPANVLIDRRGILKLADLGLSRLIGRDGFLTPHIGTRWYRAPELLFGDCSSDIDQLATVLSTLGAPNEEVWPGVTSLPDYNKILFPNMAAVPFEDLFPDCDEITLNLLEKFLTYYPKNRIRANEALQHPVFFLDPLPLQDHLLRKPPSNHRLVVLGKTNYHALDNAFPV
ncbi:cyclin-dependent kinase 20 [Anabrus simplex]|uniref:cyclin-dependent kinase 20 n=1 Tax=Anabrus simplex TaxID=316456 RepID=UPI0034DD7171